MKKYLFIAATAAAVLASCTKTETVEVSDAKFIGFDNAWIGKPTKAVEQVTAANIAEFKVYGGYDGTQEFYGVTVAPNANGEWTYSPLVPWTDEQTYNFYAYSGVDVTLTYSYADGLTFTDVTVNNDKDTQKDFIYAKKIGVSSGAECTVREKVQFTFDHLFSMVQFTIKSGFAEDVTLSISGLELYGLDSKATYNASGSADAWGTTSDALTEGSGITFEKGTAQATADTPTDYVDNCVVMPQTFSDNTVYAKFTVKANGTESISSEITKEITAKIPADTWKKGYRYNYIVTIDGQTLDFITFDAPEVTPWENEDINMVNDETTSGQVVVDNQGN